MYTPLSKLPSPNCCAETFVLVAHAPTVTPFTGPTVQSKPTAPTVQNKPTVQTKPPVHAKPVPVTVKPPAK